MGTNEKKVELLTTEKTTTRSNYFKGDKLTNDYDIAESFREYGRKKLATYSAEIEKLANIRSIEIEENYFRNGERFEINAKSYSEFVRIANMEVLSAEIEITKDYLDGKVVIAHEKRVYNITLK